MNQKEIGELKKNQTEKFAVYQKQDGALCVLSIANATDPKLVKISTNYRSYGRALVAKVRLEGRQYERAGDGGAHLGL